MEKMTEKKGKFKIKIVGIGDAGIEIIRDFGERNLPDVECFDMNTECILKTANKFVEIGRKLTNGLGSGALVKIGKQAAEEDRAAIIETIKDCDLLIIVAGLGGGTGSGSSPVVAEIAKELNIPVVAFVTLPFEYEGKFRKKNAQYGLEHLKHIVDFLFIVSDEKILDEDAKLRRITIFELYDEIDDALKKNILKTVDLLQSSKNKSIQEILKDVECDDSSYIEMFKNDAND